jgi:hypothetical protein
MSQMIETAVDHLQCIAQILLPIRASCQIGKIRGDTRTVRWMIVFIETNFF